MKFYNEEDVDIDKMSRACSIARFAILAGLRFDRSGIEVSPACRAEREEFEKRLDGIAERTICLNELSAIDERRKVERGKFDMGLFQIATNRGASFFLKGAA